MIYYIKVNRKNRNTAGAKAPADIEQICALLNMESFSMPGIPDGSIIKKHAWLLTVPILYWIKLSHICKKGDIVIFQHPMYGNRISNFFVPLIQKKGVKFIALIHDLESLRKGISGVIDQKESTSNVADNILLKHFDYVIAHNNIMKDYLLRHGFESNKVGILTIFDYLYEGSTPEHSLDEQPSIAIAGNLAPGKCSYIYKIKELDANYDVNLYGINYDFSMDSEKYKYYGSFSPEELPFKLQGTFGLVWDGKDIENCSGNTGNYLRYNNPHKASLYLSSGIPILIWKEAALADYIEELGLGYSINSLEDINGIFENLNKENYEKMCKNVRKEAEKLKNGFYFMHAIKKALNSMSITSESITK